MAKGAYIGIPYHTYLPNGYSGLEYIETSGTQYIDTGVKASDYPDGLEYIFDAMLTTTSITKRSYLFGCLNSNKRSCNVSIETNLYFYLFAGATGSQVLQSTATATSNRFTLTAKGTSKSSNDFSASIDGTSFSLTGIGTDCDMPSANIFLFACNLNGAATSSTSGVFVGRLYRFQMNKADGTPVRDFVPCRRVSDNVIGLYDTVNGKFYANAGTGTFTMGIESVARKVVKMYIGVVDVEHRDLPDGYTQVQYLESTGTQYIDTGFVPTAEDMRVVCDVVYTKTPSGTCLYGAQTTSTTFPITLGADGDKPTFFVGSSLRLLTQTMSVNTRYVLSAHAKNGTLTAGVNGATSTASYSGSLAKTLSLSLFGNNNNGKVESCASAKVYSCQIYNNGTLVRDYVPCKNASGTAGMYDMVNSKFYTNAGTGTFTAGSTTLSVARRIKKAYIGIGGVAHALMAPGVVTRLGQTNLSAKRSNFAATTIGDYALFGGGWDNQSSDVVDAFDK